MTFKFQGHTKHLSSRSSIVSVLLMFHSNCAMSYYIFLEIQQVIDQKITIYSLKLQ